MSGRCPGGSLETQPHWHATLFLHNIFLLLLIPQGDLGAIDDKYDVAISTCCGHLDSIVTDTINTAQQCVQYLKKSNKGVGTFIGIDKQAHLLQQAKTKINT